MKPFTSRDEERLIEAGRRYYSTAFPNPERVGCPDKTTLKACLRRQIDRATLERIDEHMMQCSPCFNDYVRLREARDRSARGGKVAGIAAVIALMVMSWLVVRLVKIRSQAPTPSTVESTNVTYQANLLDLRNKAALRGAEANANEADAVLPAKPLDLSIYLPTGSEPGDYDVQITQGFGEPLLKAHGQASLRDHITVLEIKLNLDPLRPGLYLFWIRQGASSWSYYPVRVQSRP